MDIYCRNLLLRHNMLDPLNSVFYGRVNNTNIHLSFSVWILVSFWRYRFLQGDLVRFSRLERFHLQTNCRILLVVGYWWNDIPKSGSEDEYDRLRWNGSDLLVIVSEGAGTSHFWCRPSVSGLICRGSTWDMLAWSTIIGYIERWCEMIPIWEWNTDGDRWIYCTVSLLYISNITGMWTHV